MATSISTAQRAELHKTIWRIANDLRGSVDGWDFKAYVLGMLFYRFICSALTDALNENEHATGATRFDYATLPDADAELAREDTIADFGYFILPSHLFENVRREAARNENLNETLDAVFKAIEGSAVGHSSENDLRGLFADIGVNSPKLGPTVIERNKKLVNLLDAIGDLPLGSADALQIDAFGDAYEYLMTMYASSAGKSGGEFFTPPEVSELLARLTIVGKTEVNKVYEPKTSDLIRGEIAANVVLSRGFAGSSAVVPLLLVQSCGPSGEVPASVAARCTAGGGLVRCLRWRAQAEGVGFCVAVCHWLTHHSKYM
ncbi:type I restriction-modification system subunit M [Trueperella pyogenes]|uniref:site-specific DNA-methyltransferase (adenine-specific) n=1 Tax=Trueperella pyogenes TaxID=1661 RepID=A0A380MDY3_9ACTO|nr:type I restriction-modification system subunit M [Trueperella pyogenes]AWG16323.1 type I restriction-modification system subunit M [Trueperella pyogenes]AZR05203.1 type I restriction-modification system subunit M [Trueperella pyogenes]AZR07166.1 type I restriction-modification system subunit M [Trueperella pyogenes]MBB3025650.1 type I restriction enzyme M protein [Trueperella pyogenes]